MGPRDTCINLEIKKLSCDRVCVRRHPRPPVARRPPQVGRSNSMADGATDPLASTDSYDAAVAEEHQLCDKLGVVPWCVRSIVPDDLRLTTAGHHKVVSDTKGNRWMSVSSYSGFIKEFVALNFNRNLPPEAVIWVVIVPQLSLQGAKDIKGLVIRSQALFGQSLGNGDVEEGSGWCCGIRFLVKNMALLDSKCKDQLQYFALTEDVMGLAETLTDGFEKMKTCSEYKDLVTVSADCRS